MSEEKDLHWESIERILFLYAKLNPGIGYIQGMNECLGPIYYVLAHDDEEENVAHAEAGNKTYSASYIYVSLDLLTKFK